MTRRALAGRRPAWPYHRLDLSLFLLLPRHDGNGPVDLQYRKSYLLEVLVPPLPEPLKDIVLGEPHLLESCRQDVTIVDDRNRATDNGPPQPWPARHEAGQAPVAE